MKKGCGSGLFLLIGGEECRDELARKLVSYY